jgi:transposase
MSDASETTPTLPDDVPALKAIIGGLAQKIAVLEEQLRLAVHKRFGASSEKADPDQLHLFNEAEALAQSAPVAEDAGAEITVPEHIRAKPGRKPIPAHLPRVRVEHDIPDAEKLCPCGSGHLRQRIGEMVSEQYDIIPATVQVLQNIRPKYGPCDVCDGVFPETPAADQAAQGGTQSGAVPSEAGAEQAGTQAAPATAPSAIIVATLPPQPIPKSNAAACSPSAS